MRRFGRHGGAFLLLLAAVPSGRPLGFFPMSSNGYQAVLLSSLFCPPNFARRTTRLPKLLAVFVNGHGGCRRHVVAEWASVNRYLHHVIQSVQFVLGKPFSFGSDDQRSAMLERKIIKAIGIGGLFQSYPGIPFFFELFKNRCERSSLDNFDRIDCIPSDFSIHFARPALDDFGNPGASS